MKIEKVDSDKIRIFLNIDDLKSNNVDFNSFMSNSSEAQNLFLYVLDLAKEEVGFSTDDYKISIETVYLNNGFFVLNITRFKNNAFTYQHKLKAIPKAASGSSFCYIFSSLDNFLDFYSVLKDLINLKDLSTCKYSLYLLNGTYYLIFDFGLNNLKYKTLLLGLLSEFSDKLKKNTPANSLLENAKCIAKNCYFN